MAGSVERPKDIPVRGYGSVRVYNGSLMTSPAFSSQLSMLASPCQDSIHSEAYRLFWNGEVNPLCGITGEDLTGDKDSSGLVLVGQWKAHPLKGLLVRLSVNPFRFDLGLHREPSSCSWADSYTLSARIDTEQKVFFGPFPSSTPRTSLDGLLSVHAIGKRFADCLEGYALIARGREPLSEKK